MNNPSTLGDNQLVKNVVKNSPEFLEDYRVVSVNSHITIFGDEYLVFGVISRYRNYTDIICDLDNNYLSLGGDDYQKTIETVERLSLLVECDRTLLSTSVYLVA